MNREDHMILAPEALAIWTAAYNAALTGLLARKSDETERFSANNVHVITDQCIAFANRAVHDAAKEKP